MARQIREKVRAFFCNQEWDEELNSFISRMVYLEDLIHNHEGLVSNIKEKKIDETYGKYLKKHDYSYIKEELKEIDNQRSKQLKESRIVNLYKHLVNKVFPINEIEKLSKSVKNIRERGERRLQLFTIEEVVNELLKTEQDVQSDYFVEHIHILDCNSCEEHSYHDFKSSSGIIDDKIFLEKFALDNYETNCKNKRKNKKNNHETRLIASINQIKPLVEDPKKNKLKDEFAPTSISFRVKSGESILKKLFGKIAVDEENLNKPDVADIYGIQILVKKEEDVKLIADKLIKKFENYKNKGWFYEIDDERYPRQKINLGGSYAPIHISVKIPYSDLINKEIKYQNIEIQIADELNKSQERTGKATKHVKYKNKQLNELEKIFKEKPLYRIMYEKILPIFDYYNTFMTKKTN